MLNEDLLTPEQRRIAQLTYTIEKFKKYDDERKEYYRKLETEIGMLRSERDELKDLLSKDEIRFKQQEDQIAQLKKNVSSLTKKIDQNAQLSKENWSNLSLDEGNIINKMLATFQLIRKQNQAIQLIKKTNDELLYRMIHPTDAATITAKLDELLSKMTETVEPSSSPIKND